MDAFFLFKLTLARVERRETSKKPFVFSRRIKMHPVLPCSSLATLSSSLGRSQDHCLPKCTKHQGKKLNKYKRATHPKGLSLKKTYNHLTLLVNWMRKGHAPFKKILFFLIIILLLIPSISPFFSHPLQVFCTHVKKFFRYHRQHKMLHKKMSSSRDRAWSLILRW